MYLVGVLISKIHRRLTNTFGHYCSTWLISMPNNISCIRIRLMQAENAAILSRVM